MVKNVQAVRRWGTSRAVVITRQVQKQLTWALREVVHVSVEDDAIVLRPICFTVGADRASGSARAKRVA